LLGYEINDAIIEREAHMLGGKRLSRHDEFTAFALGVLQLSLKKRAAT
jgi:hypothetical protein